jgi:hypothetical protein
MHGSPEWMDLLTHQHTAVKAYQVWVIPQQVNQWLGQCQVNAALMTWLV